jgi:Glycosyltransferase family 87
MEPEQRMAESGLRAAEGGAEGADQSSGKLPQPDWIDNRRSLNRRIFSVVGVCVLLALWIALFVSSGTLQRGPSPKYMGGDFVLFLSAARVIHDGGNPYDQRVLYRAERRFLERDGTTPPAFQSYMRVGNPALLFWALEPATVVSFDTSAKLWCLAMYGLLAVGFLGCLRRMGWRGRCFPLALFLAFPQTVYAAYYGNLDGLVFAALAWSAALARSRPLVAGALLTLTFLKPQVALPGALIVMLFLSPQPLRILASFTATSALGLGLTMATTGAATVGWWLQALGGYSQRLGVQPDIASLSGLYVYSASDRLRLLFAGISLLAAVVATAWWWVNRRERHTVLGVAWLWIAWFLATPFAHFHDEVVLALPILAILGRDGAWMDGWPANVAIYLLLLSILFFPTARAHTDVQSLTLLVVLGCGVVQLSRKEGKARVDGIPAWR